MATLVANCPRCGSAKITFDLTAQGERFATFSGEVRVEAFCLCRNCTKSTIFILAPDGDHDSRNLVKSGLPQLSANINQLVDIKGYIGLADMGTEQPPEHLPGEIEAVFEEGAKCMAIECHNAAGTMFRLCVDMATAALLPPVGDPARPSNAICYSLGRCIQWLFDKGKLPQELLDLAKCIKEDGNDGAHAGTLTKADSEDLLDFTKLLLTRLYTDRKQLELAGQRRKDRRGE